MKLLILLMAFDLLAAVPFPKGLIDKSSSSEYIQAYREEYSDKDRQHDRKLLEPFCRDKCMREHGQKLGHVSNSRPFHCYCEQK